MTDINPIAALLGIVPARDKHLLTIAGRLYELYPARSGDAEALYRVKGPSQAFSLLYVAPGRHRIALAQYLTGGRGITDAGAESVLRSARWDLGAAANA